MIVERTTDADIIKGVLSNPEIWGAVADKDDKVDGYEPPKGDEFIYLFSKIEDEVIGLFIVHPYEDKWKCHVQVVPGQRKKHAMDFGKSVISWIWNNTDINEMVATIPVAYPNVKAFAERQGFKDDGKMMSIKRVE